MARMPRNASSLSAAESVASRSTGGAKPWCWRAVGVVWEEEVEVVGSARVYVVCVVCVCVCVCV